MQINVQLNHGYLPDKYTRHADNQFKNNGRPFVSFPFDIQNVPADTKSIAFTLTDLDSIPVCGFEWIHWVVAGLEPHDVTIPENAGQRNPLHWTRGNNSLAGGLINMSQDPMSRGYVGPTPPNGTHHYTLTIYALDTQLPLNNGFWYNELIHAMHNHIIEKVAVDLPVK